jgi:hypothetical protein
VGIVVAQNAPATRRVQRKGVLNPVRAGGTGRHLPRAEGHPVAIADFGGEAIEIEEPLESGRGVTMPIRHYHIMITK